MRTMVTMIDYTGLPRAYGVALDPHEADREARRQLELYCAKQRDLGEVDLADPNRYTKTVSKVE